MVTWLVKYFSPLYDWTYINQMNTRLIQYLDSNCVYIIKRCITKYQLHIQMWRLTLIVWINHVLSQWLVLLKQQSLLLLQLLLNQLLLLHLHWEHEVIHPHGWSSSSTGQEVGGHLTLSLHLDFAPALELVGSGLVQHLVHVLRHLEVIKQFRINSNHRLA